jgi:hypothetical protein
VAEIALLVLLYYMIKDARKAMRKASEMKKFASKISKSKGYSDVDSLTVEEFGWLSEGDDNSTSPFFWASGDISSNTATDGKMLTKAEDAVASKLAALAKNVDSNVAEAILAKSEVSRFEGLREYVYLVINLFAFYGYASCILVYYFQDENNQPNFIRAALLWLPNAYADWLGNAVGDFMWTIEPLVILSSPLLVAKKSKKKKEKVA